VNYTECMRAHGVSDFPDADGSGEFPSYGHKCGLLLTEAMKERG
jgi:hypothetical protein